mmetsp:Transcript_27073/g.62760  ORF Transcript_27073/g.62760 Transcript_27073/m.62760 type:complete len:311 (-) Transcript_27073:1607-2539(-)
MLPNQGIARNICDDGSGVHDYLFGRDVLQNDCRRCLSPRQIILPRCLELARLHHCRRFHDQHIWCRRSHPCQHQILQVSPRPPRPPPPPRHQAQPWPQNCRRRPPFVHPSNAQRCGGVPAVVLHVRYAGHSALQGKALQLHGPPEHALLWHCFHALGQPLHANDCHVRAAGRAYHHRVRLSHAGTRYLGPQILLFRLLPPWAPDSVRDGDHGGLDGCNGSNDRYDRSWRDSHSELPATGRVVQCAAHCRRGIRASKPHCWFHHQQLQSHQEYHRGHPAFLDAGAAGVERDSPHHHEPQASFPSAGTQEQN